MVAAGYLILVSAALHLAGFMLTDFRSESLFLLFPAALYTGLFYGLTRRSIWVAWVTFLCMLGGMAGTAVELFGPSLIPLIPDWVLWGILGVDFAAAVLLFRAIRAGVDTRAT